MSHIVKIQAKFRDREAVSAACARRGLAPPVDGTAQLYSGEVKGLIVQLPEWQYPLVIDLATGVASFDNFGGAWGERQHFDAFLQSYAVEKAKIEARRRGHVVTEQTLQDGSVRLQITEGAPASS
jgi:hypothetical protein